MSQSETIARPYAKAVYEKATAEEKTEQWQFFLTALAQVTGDAEFSKRLGAHGFLAEFQSWLEEFFQATRQSGLSSEEKNFLNVLHENNRLQVIPEIAQQFEVLLNEGKNRIPVTVYTAKSLTSAQKQSIIAFLKKKAQGRGLLLKIIEKPELIAGVKIEYDGMVIDQSIQGRITNFARKLEDLRN